MLTHQLWRAEASRAEQEEAEHSSSVPSRCRCWISFALELVNLLDPVFDSTASDGIGLWTAAVPYQASKKQLQV